MFSIIQVQTTPIERPLHKCRQYMDVSFPSFSIVFIQFESNMIKNTLEYLFLLKWQENAIRWSRPALYYFYQNWLIYSAISWMIQTNKKVCLIFFFFLFFPFFFKSFVSLLSPLQITVLILLLQADRYKDLRASLNCPTE